MIHITRAMLASLLEARASSFEGFMERSRGCAASDANASFAVIRLASHRVLPLSLSGMWRVRGGGSMNWMLRVGMAAWVAGLMTACSSAPRPVPVTGEGAALSELAGQWSGEYHATGGGRQGTIMFK